MSCNTRIICLGILLSVLVFQTGAATGNELVLLTENTPPTNYINSSGQLTGSSVEIVREIMRRLGTDCPIQVLPWARAYKMALNKPMTGLFSTTRTPEREKHFQWVGPIYTQRWILYKHADNPLHISSMEDAKKVKRIGTYIADAAHSYLENEGFDNLQPVSNDMQNMYKLKSGRIDLWATGDASFHTRVTRAGMDPGMFQKAFILKEIKLFIAFSKDVPDSLIRDWQLALNRIRDEGLYQKILHRYAGNESEK